MQEYRKGTVIIKEVAQKGFLRKRTVYGGGLYGCPGIYGYSVNKTLQKEYQEGDKVKVRYQLLENSHGGADDEFMEFEILEEA